MKRLTLVLAVVLMGSLALWAPAAVVAGEKAAGKTHTVTAEVVSADAAAKTITIKDDKGEQKTAPVLGKAVDKLKDLKAGDKVTLTCKDNNKGEHEGITAIKTAKAEKHSTK